MVAENDSLSPKDADGMANSVDPDRSDLGLHCLLRPSCPKTYIENITVGGI